ncbi:type II toxin-antitoxin system HipA family toxin [Leptospira ognonensis]|uniref:Type II toxin-antitoxin system HipA family toxin n=1 Tax=Leptospira ognonensis TaxID=2484945 RepID=A0A4R9JZ54_9LEPT|nr:HipA domain-containing protein [Leptospira ognonensis]TGL58659.1 type II toxin-antitoxin system HipA family toxin [Leptospira ognonensis]
MSHCLFCTKPSVAEFHPICANLIFGEEEVPEFSIRLEDFKEIAEKNLSSRISLTGMQSKISLALEDIGENKAKPARVHIQTDYILRAPSDEYPNLPENEHLTMLMAKQFSFEVATSSLIRLASGELCHLTKRSDRKDGIKLAQEDFCQLTERLTEDKYKGSYESIARWIRSNTTAPGIDLVRFFELVLFSYLTGNSDMHLKNFSIQTDLDGRIRLAPAYDLLSVHMILPEDKEEMALTLNGKKNKISTKDWEEFANSITLPTNVFEKTMEAFKSKIPILINLIESYPFTDSFQKRYVQLLKTRMKKI